MDEPLCRRKKVCSVWCEEAADGLWEWRLPGSTEKWHWDDAWSKVTRNGVVLFVGVGTLRDAVRFSQGYECCNADFCRQARIELLEARRGLPRTDDLAVFKGPEESSK
jgi:hypothetical protein